MPLCSKRHASPGSGLYVRPPWGGCGGNPVIALGFAERLERPVETPPFLAGVLRLRLAALRALVLPLVLFHAPPVATGVRGSSNLRLVLPAAVLFTACECSTVLTRSSNVAR